MGKCWCALGCFNQFYKGCGFHFYCFPVDTDRRNQWVAAVNRKNWQPTPLETRLREHKAANTHELINTSHFGEMLQSYIDIAANKTILLRSHAYTHGQITFNELRLWNTHWDCWKPILNRACHATPTF